MLSTSDPLFWLIAAGMTLPWGLVVWLGMEAQRLRAARDLWCKRAIDEARRYPPPFDMRTPAEIVPLRVITGGGRRVGRTVDVPFKGTINHNDRPGVEL